MLLLNVLLDGTNRRSLATVVLVGQGNSFSTACPNLHAA